MKRKSTQNEVTLLSEMIHDDKISSFQSTLLRLDRLIPWEDFRPLLLQVRKPSPKGGRPPYDEILMFRRLILQELYGLSDEALEFQILDRRSFQMFLGMNIASDVPDARTIWRLRELLKSHDLIKKLFDRFNEYLSAQGVIAREGRIVDATFVETPRPHNTREENRLIKENKDKEEVFPTKSDRSRSQKDTDARGAYKRSEYHFGYKDAVSVDPETKLVENYEVTSANVHDSRQLLSVLTSPEHDGSQIYADSAYSSAELSQRLLDLGYRPEICARSYRNRPLTETQKLANSYKSRIRSRVEHVFGDIKNRRGGLLIRTIGIARARVKRGLINLAYNMRRYVSLLTGKLIKTAF